jgi:hypothetical protein
MIDIKEKKEKITSFLETNGPSLPVRISTVIEMEPVFASAILSELYNEGKIKMSSMKVGSSHLYFLPGHEVKLENFSENLKQLEKEALTKLKTKKVLDDDKEEPAIRVALSNMKDFATKINNSDKEIWRYNFATDDEINEILNPKKEEIKVEAEKEEPEKPVIKEIKHEKKKETEPKKKIEKSENLQIIEEIKSEFFDEVENYLKKREIFIYEKIQIDKKEIIAKINSKTNFGELNYLLVAKNKRSVGKDEISGIMQKVYYHKMPCLLILKKEIPKSLFNFIKNNNFIKIEGM